MEHLTQGVDVLFILLGAVMILAMHAGFAFLEVGTVREKNQVNALVKILADLSVSGLAYFFIGYWIAYGVNFFHPAITLNHDHGYGLTKFFFLFTFPVVQSLGFPTDIPPIVFFRSGNGYSGCFDYHFGTI